MRPSRELSLGFVVIKVSLRYCTELLPEVSPLFDRAEATLGNISPTYVSLPEVSLETLSPRKFSLGFVAIEVSLWRWTKLLPIAGEVSPTYSTPLEFYLGFVTIKLSLRSIVGCYFCNLFDAHGGWVHDRRNARSLNIPSYSLAIYQCRQQLDVWDVWAKSWG